MDLEKKLRFLTGNDEYDMPDKSSHTDEDDFPLSDGIPSHFISTDEDDDSLDSLSIDSDLRLDDHKPSKKGKKKGILPGEYVFEGFFDPHYGYSYDCYTCGHHWEVRRSKNNLLVKMFPYLENK